jgi:UDP-N-acetylglucosamine/UDP-N-acetylgalactosamine diphosphorylase
VLAEPAADSRGAREALDANALSRAFRRALALRQRGVRGLAPAPVLRLDAAEERAQARKAGEQMLAAGRVAALVVAGGQASRLSHPGPKGLFPLGPVSGRSLFELQAQKLLRLEGRFRRRVPWIVMTSEATDAETQAFFASQRSFGLEMSFARQREAPCVDFSGRPLFTAPGQPATAPDGHGGMLRALDEAGLLDRLAARGIQALAYHQVDNPLARLADPLLLGLLVTHGAEVATKVVRKVRPDERLGTVGLCEGRIQVIEYTELAADEAEAREADGGLRLWAGAIGLHAFSLDFLRRLAPRAEELLPFHASPKPIPCIDAEGRPVAPREPNGYKLERFVFDLLPEARALAMVEARREDEYAPVKNADGGESPASARRALDACARRWLAAAGWTLPPDSVAIELDHSVIDGPEDAARLTVRDATAAGPVVRLGPGVLP